MAQNRRRSLRRGGFGLAATVLAAVFATACASNPAAADRAPEQALSPSQRAAVITTTGCGFAADRSGSGVAMGNGLVVTVAHLVVQSDEIAVSAGGSELGNAIVLGIDLKRDLAVLAVEDGSLPAVVTARATVGAQGSIVGGAASGTVGFEVSAVVDVSIEEVLGTERHERRGYELGVQTQRGDSGAGAYDEAGRLLGVVFAFSEDPSVTWVTASQEIEAFLSEVVDEDQTLACDPDRSRLDTG